MLVGGRVNSFASSRVFRGTVSSTEKDVTWKELEPMRNARREHITFKMKENLYVVGGYGRYLLDISLHYRDNILSSCERFDMVKNKWFTCQHSLPYPLCDASVIVSDDETFAVITGGRKENHKLSDGCITFTEDGGFKHSKTYSLLSPRWRHVSIRTY